MTRTRRDDTGRWLRVVSVAFCFGLLVLVSRSEAAHPLITDDTGTQGKGKFQLELNGEYGSDREASLGIESMERAIEAGATLSHGIIDSLDAVLGVAYIWVEGRETDITIPDSVHASEKGISDLSFELKWRFFEKEGLSLAIKPGISAPTGNERKGLGAGKYGLSTHLIVTQELEPWEFHINLGYIRNNSRFDERENLCHLSLAAEFELVEGLELVANIGQERNPDKSTKRKPVFGLLGVIYELAENLDLDAGIKVGITDPETDITALAGMAWRF